MDVKRRRKSDESLAIAGGQGQIWNLDSGRPSDTSYVIYPIILLVISYATQALD